MRFLLQSRSHLCAFTIAIAAACCAKSVGHEITRRTHETSLDPREDKAFASARTITSVAPASLPATPTAQLRIQLLDARTRKPLPGLVRVLQSDGQAVPLAGLVSRGTKLRNDHPAKNWFALIEPAVVPVPRAPLTIEAFSGLQTELTRLTVDLAGKESAELDIPLKAFVDSGDSGWFSGNTHLHLSGLTREQADEYLRTVPRADRLDLVFVSYLERVQADRDYISNGYSLADLERIGGRDLIFGNGEEHRHNFDGFGEGYGHVMFLNIRNLVRPVSIGPGIMGEGPDWPPMRNGIAQARHDGATVIWCHNNFGHEEVPDWLDGLLDAHNIFDGDPATHGSYEDTFYRYLNIGLKVPFSTGTDWFIYDFSRVYARLEKNSPLNVRSWLLALAAGRSFISNGPLLEFHVNKSEIGDTLSLPNAASLFISGRALGRQNFKQLELVHNGKVIHSVTNRSVDGHFEAAMDYSFPIQEPGWLALRVSPGETKNEMGETIFAHTSPVFIEVGGKTVFKKESAAALLADMESALKVIPTKARFANDSQREEVLRIYRNGIAVLHLRLGQ